MSDPIQTDARKRVIVALDTNSVQKAMDIVKLLVGEIGMVKIGMELFPRGGPEMIKAIQNEGIDVFLDLKYHDIPNTVAGAIRTAVALGVKLCTVHASGGSKMLKAAAEAAKDSSLTILAVTVLTSLDDDDLREVGCAYSVRQEVLRLADLAVRHCGIGGLVCSAQETLFLRTALGGNVKIVNPGIRFPEGNADDQKRVVSPDEAMNSGANYIVVGRPITQAFDPAAAARKFVQAISMGMVERSGG